MDLILQLYVCSKYAYIRRTWIFIDSSNRGLGASIAVTDGTNVVAPVYSTANTGTLATAYCTHCEQPTDKP